MNSYVLINRVARQGQQIAGTQVELLALFSNPCGSWTQTGGAASAGLEAGAATCMLDLSTSLRSHLPHPGVGRSHIPYPGGQVPHPISGWADPTSRIRVGRSVPINVQLKPLALGQELKFLLRSVPNIHIAVEPAAALADVEQRVIAHDPRIILFSGVGIPLVGWDRTRTGLGPRHRSHHHPCWIPPSPMLDPAIGHAGSRSGQGTHSWDPSPSSCQTVGSISRRRAYSSSNSKPLTDCSVCS